MITCPTVRSWSYARSVTKSGSKLASSQRVTTPDSSSLDSCCMEPMSSRQTVGRRGRAP